MLDNSLLKLFLISSIYCSSWRHSCWCESTPNPSQSLTWGIIFLLSLKKMKKYPRKKNSLFTLNFATPPFLELLVLELWPTVANNYIWGGCVWNARHSSWRVSKEQHIPLTPDFTEVKKASQAAGRQTPSRCMSNQTLNSLNIFAIVMYLIMPGRCCPVTAGFSLPPSINTVQLIPLKKGWKLCITFLPSQPTKQNVPDAEISALCMASLGWWHQLLSVRHSLRKGDKAQSSSPKDGPGCSKVCCHQGTMSNIC